MSEEKKAGILSSIRRSLAYEEISAAEKEAADAKAERDALKVENKTLQTEAAEKDAEIEALRAALAEREKEVRALKEQLEEAKKTPEEKTEKALREISEVQKSAVYFKPSMLFKPNFGAAYDYIKDPEVVAAIIKQYPESIKEIPTEYFAEHYEEFTTSFIDGMSEICMDPENEQYRSDINSMTHDKDGKHIDYNKEVHLEQLIYAGKSCFKTKISDVFVEARRLVEFRPEKYPNVKGEDIRMNPYETSKVPEDASVERKYIASLVSRKKEASIAASIVAGKTNAKKNENVDNKTEEAEPGAE